jgi:GR25 family glycosyltransferase involved in LPS biosynthesis
MAQQSSHPYHGLYINLDRSPERRRNMEEQFAALGLQDIYTRFPAVDGKTIPFPQSPLGPGEIGVFLSHRQALEAAKAKDKPVHILEDDALLTPHVSVVIEDAIEGNLFDLYDLLFTDIIVNCEISLLKNLKQAFEKTKFPASGPLRLSHLQLIDLARVNFASTLSYVAGAKSIEKVIALYDQEIANGLTVPIDIFLRRQVHKGKLRAVCTFPFITAGRLEEVIATTVEDRRLRAGRESAVVIAVLHYLFFAGRDLDYAQRVLDTATEGPRTPTERHHALIMQAAEFVMSPDFEDF